MPILSNNIKSDRMDRTSRGTVTALSPNVVVFSTNAHHRLQKII